MDPPPLALDYRETGVIARVWDAGPEEGAVQNGSGEVFWGRSFHRHENERYGRACWRTV